MIADKQWINTDQISDITIRKDYQRDSCRVFLQITMINNKVFEKEYHCNDDAEAAVQSWL